MTSNTNPRTRAALHGQLDALLSPAPATGATETPAAGTGSLVDELQGVLDTTVAARRALAARSTAATTLTEAAPTRANETIPDGTIFHNVPLYEGLNEPLDTYPWDPMPTSGDPLGLKERMGMLEIAIAARDAHGAPPRVEADPHAHAGVVRLVEAHQRLDEILG